MLVCRARRRRRHAGRRGGDSRCCGLLRFVFGALRLWGLRPLRLTGTALDGCQGMMPAQKLELRPIFVDFRRVLAPRWRSEAAAVGMSGGVMLSAGEPARMAGAAGADAAALLCGVDCGAVVRRHVTSLSRCRHAENRGGSVLGPAHPVTTGQGRHLEGRQLAPGDSSLARPRPRRT